MSDLITKCTWHSHTTTDSEACLQGDPYIRHNYFPIKYPVQRLEFVGNDSDDTRHMKCLTLFGTLSFPIPFQNHLPVSEFDEPTCACCDSLAKSW